MQQFGRLILVVVLGIAFLGTIGMAMGAVLFVPFRFPELKVLLDTLLPAETALLGVAVAFYFQGRPEPPGPRA